jgi:hypothetical protein
MGNSSNDTNGKSKQRAMTIAIAAPIVIFASIFIAWAFVRKKRKIQRFPTRSTSMAALHGGKMSLHRLADYHEARDNAATLDRAETELKNLLEEEQPDFEQLQVWHFYISKLANFWKNSGCQFFCCSPFCFIQIQSLLVT